MQFYFPQGRICQSNIATLPDVNVLTLLQHRYGFAKHFSARSGIIKTPSAGLVATNYSSCIDKAYQRAGYVCIIPLERHCRVDNMREIGNCERTVVLLSQNMLEHEWLHKYIYVYILISKNICLTLVNCWSISYSSLQLIDHGLKLSIQISLPSCKEMHKLPGHLCLHPYIRTHLAKK